MSLGAWRSVFLPGVALSTAIWMVGCENGVDAPNDPSVAQVPTPTPAVAQAPSPTPSPTQEPTPASSAPNHPPTVTVTGGASCYPRPCQVTFEADARDPDGDALEYSWSGCASGRKRTALCDVSGLGEFEATVKVTDGRGGKATGTGTAAYARRTASCGPPSTSPARSWDRITPLFPRAPMSAPRGPPSRKARSVATMLSPVSPSATGKTLSALTWAL